MAVFSHQLLEKAAKRVKLSSTGRKACIKAPKWYPFRGVLSFTRLTLHSLSLSLFPLSISLSTLS